MATDLIAAMNFIVLDGPKMHAEFNMFLFNGYKTLGQFSVYN